MESSGFNNLRFLWKIYETRSSRRTAIVHLKSPSENKIDDNNNPIENNTESLQGETSVEPNNTQQNPLQILESFQYEIITEYRPNPAVELQG